MQYFFIYVAHLCNRLDCFPLFLSLHSLSILLKSFVCAVTPAAWFCITISSDLFLILKPHILLPLQHIPEKNIPINRSIWKVTIIVADVQYALWPL